MAFLRQRLAVKGSRPSWPTLTEKGMGWRGTLYDHISTGNEKSRKMLPLELNMVARACNSNTQGHYGGEVVSLKPAWL